MISGVLAAVMLLSTAYAAEGSTPDGTAAADTAVSADAAEQTVKLVFKADTPLTGANGDMVTEILKNRLAALGYKDSTVTVSADGTNIQGAKLRKNADMPKLLPPRSRIRRRFPALRTTSCSRRPSPRPMRTARSG